MYIAQRNSIAVYLQRVITKGPDRLGLYGAQELSWRGKQPYRIEAIELLR